MAPFPFDSGVVGFATRFEDRAQPDEVEYSSPENLPTQCYLTENFGGDVECCRHVLIIMGGGIIIKGGSGL